MSEWVRFNVLLNTLQVISKMVLQAITCTGMDKKINGKINQTNKKTQNTIIYYLHKHTHKRNIN